MRITQDPISAQLEVELLAALRGDQPQGANESLTLALRDDGGVLIGGLNGSTSYGWLLVKLLWVDQPHRGQGHAQRLMKTAIDWAQDLGCHGVWLDTSNQDAMAFYERFGFEVFGQLQNQPGEWPESHRRWFMQRRFAPLD